MLASDLLSRRQKWPTDIQNNKTRFRREGIVRAGIIATAERQGAPGSMAGRVRDAERLGKRAVDNAGQRLVERKARAVGRRLNPNASVDEGAMGEAGKLRVAASDLGYKVRAQIAKTGTKPTGMIEEAKRLRKAADSKALSAIGATEADMPRRWNRTPEARSNLADKTMAHNYGKLGKSGREGRQAKRVVEGYEKNQSFVFTSKLISLLQATPYGGISTASQFRAEKGFRTARYRTPQKSVARTVMEKKSGRKITRKTTEHIEEVRKGKEPTPKPTKLPVIKFPKITIRGMPTRIRSGSMQTHIRSGSRGRLRTHATEAR